ncbi:hypothetical protein WJ24_24615 [Burkholderia vietnamiensis]|nr:hypothetical protein WI97_17205 [Burkholderia vietnamiensis]KVE75510.1 hypothetical protein WI98_00300 [Burkholderia vietnamiensis]KVG06289.1 hypothetical protein WJ24_24615 [Burkholderia vietnamiensis]
MTRLRIELLCPCPATSDEGVQVIAGENLNMYQRSFTKLGRQSMVCARFDEPLVFAEVGDRLPGRDLVRLRQYVDLIHRRRLKLFVQFSQVHPPEVCGNRIGMTFFIRLH